MKKALLVEDEFVIALATQQTLQSLGYEVVAIADSLPEAERFSAETQPDFILLDIHLQSGENGFEVLEKIRRITQAPVIFLSGNSDPVARQRAEEAGAAGFLVKPLDEELLADCLAQLFPPNIRIAENA